MTAAVIDLARYRGDQPGESGLPPQEVWLIADPEKTKIDTPLDDRGLVAIPELIQVVKDTIDPGYTWPMHLSVHHLYWQGWWYQSGFAGPYANAFRELPINKALVPRVFENWLHKVTIPPPVPDPEVMRYRVESWAVAKNLFKSVRQAVVWEKRARRRDAFIRANPSVLPEEFEGEDLIGRAVLEDTIRDNFRNIERNLELLYEIPPEFRLIEPDATQEDLTKGLGKIVVPKALQLVGAVAA